MRLMALQDVKRGCKSWVDTEISRKPGARAPRNFPHQIRDWTHRGLDADSAPRPPLSSC